MRRSLVAVALTLLAIPSSAAVLGPERPLAPAASIAAPFEQIRPDVAANDAGVVLAVWLDGRGSIPAVAGSQAYSLYASTLDADARPLAPSGMAMKNGVDSAQVASAGSDFLVVYGTSSDGNVYAVRTADGVPAPQPMFLGSGTVIDVASNGDTYCAILSDQGQSQFRAVLLGSDSWPLAVIDLPDRIDAVIATGGAYLAIGSTLDCSGTCTRDVTTTKIDAAGTATRHVVASHRPARLRTAGAAGETGAIVMWVGEDDTGRMTESALVDGNGQKTGAVTRVHLTPAEELQSSGGDDRPSVAFDGSRYLAGFPVPRSGGAGSFYMVTRINAAGAVTDPYPFALTSAMDSGFVAAESGRDVLVVWSEHGDVRGRSVRSFAVIDTPEDPDVVITRASDVQSDVTIATTDSAALAAWVEGDHANTIVASLFDPDGSVAAAPFTISGYGNVIYAAPSFAAAGDRFLIVWRESYDDESRVYAQRISASGALLDAAPLLLDVSARPQVEVDGGATDTAVASDGTNFFAVWRHEQELHGARIDREGHASTPFRVSSGEPNVHARVSPAVVWSGSMYLVAWQHATTAAPPVADVRLARVTSGGVLLDTRSVTSATMDGAAESVALARGGDRVMVLWPLQTNETCIRGALLDAEGNFVSEPEPFDCAVNGLRNDVAAVWNGHAFVAAWSRGSGAIDAARITSSGDVHERFTLSAGGALAWSPVLVSWRDRTLAAYAQVTRTASHGGVGRVTTRSVAFSKTRAARR